LPHNWLVASSSRLDDSSKYLHVVGRTEKRLRWRDDTGSTILLEDAHADREEQDMHRLIDVETLLFRTLLVE